MIDKEKLIYYRELNNIEINKLAKKIKCSKHEIELWESGEIIPTEKQLEKLCKFYKITVDDLMVEEKKSISALSIIISFILIIIGLVIGYLINSLVYALVLPIMNVICYFIIKSEFNNFKESKNVDDTIPKSLFGLVLSNSKSTRKRIYLIESILLSSIYVIISIIFKLFDINELILNIRIFDNNNVNEGFLILSTYLLLMFLSYIIELVFGEYMIKNNKGD